MAIFRGDGGAGDSNTDSTLNLVTAQAVIATTKASDAAASAVSAGDSATSATTSKNAAATSATSAANSEQGVANSATAAAASATEASTSETNAATSAAASATSATAASASQTASSASESNASTSATTATTKASQAATSETNAATSASTATTKASEAATSASNASTSESNAATSASGASTSATNAASSETASAASASGSATSAANASNSASAAAATLAASALKANNLSDLADAGTARSNLGLGDGATPAFGIANMTVVDTALKVVDTTNLQTYVDGVDSALFRARGTGFTTKYTSTVAIGGTTFSQPAVSGEIRSDQGYFNINYAGATGVTVATLTAPSTYVYIDKDGTLQQQITVPTREDWSRKMFTMRIAMDLTTSTIVGFAYLNNPIGNYANSIRDIATYLLAQGVPFKKNQTITGRASDLGFDISAGTLMEFGSTGDIDNPNIKAFDAVANAEFFLTTRTAFDAGGNTALPKLWDNNGVLTALGSTTLVGHRLYRFSNGNVCLQYGQGNYANMVLAKAGVLLEDYVLNPILENATFFGWWFIESTATNTGGTTLTDFVEYTIGVQGGSSSGLAGCLLKGNNLSDLLDASAARTNLGLGTAATTASTAYATTAQGVKADSALQSDSTLNADNMTTGTLNGGTY